MAKQKTDSEKQEKNPPKEVPVWEWIVAAIGLILVVGSISLMLYRAFTEESTPPILSVNVDSVSPTENGYLIRFSVKNAGNTTAADLAIEGELKSGSEIVETSSAVLTYAPANSNREGGLFFTKNPNDFELNIRPVGYSVP